jgi:hypothetical protein
MKISIYIKKEVEVDVEIDDMISAINGLPMDKRWNHVAQIFKGIELNKADLTNEQRDVVRKFLELHGLVHFNVDTYLLDCGGGVKLMEIGVFEVNDDEQVESISLDFEYNNKTFEVLWLAENIDNLDYPRFSSVDGPSEGFDGFKASVESPYVMKVLVPYCSKWIADKNERLNAEILD